MQSWDGNTKGHILLLRNCFNSMFCLCTDCIKQFSCLPKEDIYVYYLGASDMKWVHFMAIESDATCLLMEMARQ